MSLVEMRTSLSSIVHGQTRTSTSLQALPGLGSGSRRSSIIGSEGWLLNIIVLRNSFLAGPSTDRALVDVRRPQLNFFSRLSLGLVIRIHELERHGRRARDSRSSSRIVEPYWFWMAWSRSKTHPGRKRVDCVSLRFKHSCAGSLLSIPGLW